MVSHITLGRIELPLGLIAAGAAFQLMDFEPDDAEYRMGLFALDRHLAAAQRAFTRARPRRHDGFALKGGEPCLQGVNLGWKLTQPFPERQQFEDLYDV